MIRQREFKLWREKSASAIVRMLRACVLEASAEESVRLERPRREARTNWGGLFDGQRLERKVGKTDADCRGAINLGPPREY